MKWYEIIIDNGDGTSSVRRFHYPCEALRFQEKFDYEDLIISHIDTDAHGFFYDSSIEDF